MRLDRIGGVGSSHSGHLHQEWRESKSAAVELIKSLAEAESVFIDGKPATAAQLKMDFERRYGLQLSDFDQLLYATDTRKKDAVPYLTKLKEAFLRRRERLGK